MRFLNFITLTLVLLSVTNTWALPIDWHGTFGVDSTRITDYRRGAEPNTSPPVGSEVIPSAGGNRNNASFQSYVFRLNPNIVVNDSASIFGEITTGYGRGGFMGDGSVNRQNTSPNTPNRSFGNSLYYYNTSSSDSNLVLNKFYMELYSDAATFVIGRQPINFGLGALFNEGSGTWDRHTSVNDGFSAKLKFSNFKFVPHWAKINSASGNRTDAANVSDYGIQAMYDNPDKDMVVGIYYGKRKSQTNSNYYKSGALLQGDTNLKLIDVFFKKGFGKLSTGLEIPLASGNMGHVYNANDKVSYSAKAVVLETKYEFSEKWTGGLMAGQISGSDGDQSKFGAMYLNPNYQVANLLYRYNLYAIADATQSVWDSYMTNTRYAKLFGKYQNESWVWNAGLLYAQAEQVAKVGTSFDHERNASFTATENQKKDLGYELDAGFDFLWNPNVTLSGNGGYLFTGDYYKYTNSGTQSKVKNMYVTSLSVAVTF
ncbi:MAG: hypothetical protein ACOYL6_04100 [Bacteriovoracaceae bacterium]